MKNTKLQQTAYWCYKAKLKMANCYLRNLNWIGDMTKLERTHAFFADLASNFPLKEGKCYDNLDLCDPLWKTHTIKSIEVQKKYLGLPTVHVSFNSSTQTPPFPHVVLSSKTMTFDQT